MNKYELKALKYAEKYGIINYSVKNNVMTYIEFLPIEGTFKATVDLDTMKEVRTLIKEK